MIKLNPIKHLLLEKPAQPNRPAHLSAASGLVRVGPWLYVVADDELHLGKFLLDENHPGELHRLFSGELPMDTEARKAEKPDIEVLTLIQSSIYSNQPALLALGSGSKKNRQRSAIIPLDNQGSISREPKILDLSHFYEFLKDEIGKLNIEGAAVTQEYIYLFQRGNKKNKLNASIRIDLDDFYCLLSNPKKNYQPKIKIKPYDLGEVDDVPFCFTDATALPNGDIVFTASAENTSSSYLDGACMGSLIGRINAKGDLQLLEPVDKTIKLEGVEATVKNNSIELLLVSDADDETRPAQLFSASFNV
jgi:hypothetical protein